MIVKAKDVEISFFLKEMENPTLKTMLINNISIKIMW